MHKLKTFIASKPLFIYLLPLFFVLHGFTSYYFVVPVKDAVSLLFIYLLVAQGITVLFWLVFKNWTRAALACLFLLSFQFFFGTVLDSLKQVVANSFICRYSFLIPFSLILFIVWLFYLKRSQGPFVRLFTYINLLLVLLITIDIASLVLKTIKNNSIVTVNEQLTICDSCSKPNIYLIVVDEYPGKKELTDLFSFDNSPFEKQLQERGFHVINNTKSNYNWTPYSLASTFNFNYLHLKTNQVNMHDLMASADAIETSSLFQFLKKNGYTFYNHSIFTIDAKPSPLRPVFLSSRKLLITAPTFTSRSKKDIGSNFKTKAELESIKRTFLFNNKEADSLTKQISASEKDQTKFVYTHLMLPHYPYFFDSSGNENPSGLLEDIHKIDKKLFINYLIYSNRKILELIDHILKASAQPPLVILMSDHGFRQFVDTTDHSYYFMNLNAVLLPDKKYAGFYDGMSNVNQFRVLLNAEFGQHLPLLKDSSIFLSEK